MKNLSGKVVLILLSLCLGLTFCSTPKGGSGGNSPEPEGRIDPDLIGSWRLEGIRGGDAITPIFEDSQKLILSISVPPLTSQKTVMEVEMRGPCSRRTSTLFLPKDGGLVWGEFSPSAAACDVTFEERVLELLKMTKTYSIFDKKSLSFSTEGENFMLTNGLSFERE